jgi:hypothetical protein
LRRSRVIVLLLCIASLVFACGWDPHRPFDRNAPAVEQAIAAYDAGDAQVAAQLLQDYLSTGPCTEGNIGTPDLVKKRPNGTIDLGLSLFSIAESYGRRFGEEEMDAGWGPEDKSQRGVRVACALRVVRAIAEDPNQSVESRARARYLEGNLDFLNGEYKDAVEAYDRALALAPGRQTPDGSASDPMDALGRDAAYNRAIAMRRQKDQENKDAGDEGGSDGGQNGDSGNGDSGNDSGKDGGGSSGDDAGDSGKNDDGGQDSGPPPPPKDQDAGPPPPQQSKTDQDERILDQLERAPTLQQEAARRQGAARVRGMVDK